MNRRDFLTALGAFSAYLVACGKRPDPEKRDLNSFMARVLEEFALPGMSLAVTRAGELVHSSGHGFADVAKQIAMTPETLLNIGSISKTITATAAMQLWEAKAFTLDQDVNDFLDFSVRNPGHPEVPITFRQLLAHRSSIADGPAYSTSYHCGDPSVSLTDWIQGYFTPEGRFWHRANFSSWSPGTVRPPDLAQAYSNVAYGLLGRLVEVITGQDFAAVCREKILTPLGMVKSGWNIRDVDTNLHAVPYTHLGEDFEPPEDGDFEAMLPQPGLRPDTLKPGGLFPHCLYSFFNYPDGLLRSSVTELASFLRAYMRAFDSGENTLLRSDTVKIMLSDEHFGTSLCWARREANRDNFFWGHSGGDPGISTYLGFQPGADLGIVVLFNSGSPRAAHDRVFFQVLNDFA